MQVIKYMFQPHGDDRGQLIALEELKDIPFHIRRVYYLYDTAKGVVRGKHAHRNLEQILVCIHGSCKVRLDNGEEKKVVLCLKPCFQKKNHNNRLHPFNCSSPLSVYRNVSEAKYLLYSSYI